MSRLGRYWLFFVIVAVGLALSWGQVGVKTRRALAEEPVVYLAVESACFADRQPCAAIAGDHALVLGPMPGGFRLKQTGYEDGGIIRVEASALDDTASETRVLAVGREAAAWSILTPVDRIAAVRVRVVGNGRVSVADFPVAGPAAAVQ